MDNITPMEAKTMTKASEIANLLYDDGYRWETSDGLNLATLCEQSGGVYRRWSDDISSWIFDDQSAITVSGYAWDLGYPDCGCWQGVGHKDDCEQRKV